MKLRNLISLNVLLVQGSCQSDPYQFRAAYWSHERQTNGVSWICFNRVLVQMKEDGLWVDSHGAGRWWFVYILSSCLRAYVFENFLKKKFKKNKRKGCHFPTWCHMTLGCPSCFARAGPQGCPPTPPSELGTKFAAAGRDVRLPH